MLTEVTFHQVVQLGREAMESGNLDLADTCIDALLGCEDAWCECVRVIREEKKRAV